MTAKHVWGVMQNSVKELNNTEVKVNEVFGFHASAHESLKTAFFVVLQTKPSCN